MSIQSVYGVYNPYYYSQNFGANSVPVSVQQPLIQTQELPILPETPQEDPSLTNQCLTNVGLFGGIKGIQYGRHPINTIKGAINAGRTYASNAEALKGLSTVQKGEAFSTLFDAARLEPRMINSSFTAKLSELQNNYINALKTGKPVDIARTGAELKTFAAKSKGGMINGIQNVIYNIKNPIAAPPEAGVWGKTTNWFKSTFRPPTVDMTMAPAIESGTAAAKIAEEAKNATEAAKSLNGFQKAVGTGKQWFKQGGGWFAIGIESLMQAPELIAAYSEGEKGDGIKQTVKSATTVAVNTTGWIAGAKLGAIGGTKLGALIGSIFPGAGTAIGAAIGGFVGSLVGMAVGSWGAGKVSKAVVGKSFTEQRAEKMAKQQQIAQQMLLTQQKNNPNYVTNPFYKQGMQIYP